MKVETDDRPISIHRRFSCGIPNSHLQCGRCFVLHHVLRFSLLVQRRQQGHHQLASFGGFRVLLYKIFQPLYLEPSPKRVVIGIDN